MHVTLTTDKAPNAIPVHGDFLTNTFYNALVQHQAYSVQAAGMAPNLEVKPLRGFMLTK